MSCFDPCLSWTRLDQRDPCPFCCRAIFHGRSFSQGWWHEGLHAEYGCGRVGVWSGTVGLGGSHLASRCHWFQECAWSRPRLWSSSRCCPWLVEFALCHAWSYTFSSLHRKYPFLARRVCLCSQDFMWSPSWTLSYAPWLYQVGSRLSCPYHPYNYSLCQLKSYLDWVLLSNAEKARRELFCSSW